MATFTNFATLSYNGGSTNSNTVTGEILETLAATKTAVVPEYTTDGSVTYVISLINSGTVAVSDLTLTDDLGGYTSDTETLYPLQYTDGSLRYYIGGVLQPAPTVTAGPPMVITGINVPASGNALIIYQATPTAFASPVSGSTLTNTVTLSGAGLSADITATETVTVTDSYSLSVNKALSPAVVTENGTVTYTFTVENYGNTEAVSTDNVILSDTFDPILSNITAVYNGTALVSGTDFTYDEATGEFATAQGVITVPAATYTQGTDGTWSTSPGTAVITVTGTV